MCVDMNFVLFDDKHKDLLEWKTPPASVLSKKMSTIEAWIIILRKVNLPTDYDRGGGGNL